MIANEQSLAEFLPRLAAAEWVGFDTEADSLHAYPEKLCLIQISIPGENRLVDPLFIADLRPLFQALEGHQLILHGSDYDLRLLKRGYDWLPTGLFDTMHAARLLGEKELGLAGVVQNHLGVTLEKGPQKADWGQRPLTERMETYARNDTLHLRALAEKLTAELRAAGRLSWHEETCRRLIREAELAPPPDPENMWRVKGSHALTPRGLSVLREIWRWREREAVQANRPPFFVLSPDLMVRMADAAAEGRDLDGLLPRRFSPRRRASLLKAIACGRETKETHLPYQPRLPRSRMSESQIRRYKDLEGRRDHYASQARLDPSIIASRATLVALARDGREAEGELMEWQRQILMD